MSVATEQATKSTPFHTVDQAPNLYRVLSTAFDRPVECLGVFNADRTASIHRTAIGIANRLGEEVCVEQLVAPDLWHTADLIGDFGMVMPS